MPVLPELPWFDRLDGWRRQLTSEVIALPSTLQEFREGVSNFQRITSRLLDATDALEQFTRLYMNGMADTRRQVDEVNRMLREGVGSPASDLVIGAVSELTDALSSMARLNPLLRRPPSPGPEPSSPTEEGD
ncbi:MAG TPA: hypothetical protein VHT49_03635 [Acidimicrobiales bacterium]|nr:hypothetical protein [Acidimicrobiales bacterium]